MNTLITRTPTRAVGAKIRELRNASQLSQRELANLSDVHPTNLGKIERGRANPSVETLARIAAALGSTVAELTEYITTPLTPLSDPPRPPEMPTRRGLGLYSAMGHSSSLPSG